MFPPFKIQKVFILFLLIVLEVQNSFGCDCLMTPIKWHVSDAYDIVIGEAIMRTDSLSIDDKIIIKIGIAVDTLKSQNVIFKVDTTLKGNISDLLIQFQGFNNCDIHFKIGFKYILFLNQSLEVIRCSYSEVLDRTSTTYASVMNFMNMDKEKLEEEVLLEKNIYEKWYKRQLKKRK